MAPICCRGFDAGIRTDRVRSAGRGGKGHRGHERARLPRPKDPLVRPDLFSSAGTMVDDRSSTCTQKVTLLSTDLLRVTMPGKLDEGFRGGTRAVGPDRGGGVSARRDVSERFFRDGQAWPVKGLGKRSSGKVKTVIMKIITDGIEERGCAMLLCPTSRYRSIYVCHAIQFKASCESGWARKFIALSPIPFRHVPFHSFRFGSLATVLRHPFAYKLQPAPTAAAW